MNLNIFSPDTLPQRSITRGQARVSLGKNGAIKFNRHACDLMQFEKGDRIAITQDGDNPENWYVFKMDTGFELKEKPSESGLFVNHTALRDMILNCFSLNLDENHSYLIAGIPTVINKCKYWGILITA